MPMVFVFLTVNVYLMLFTYQNISDLVTRILPLTDRGHCVVFAEGGILCSALFCVVLIFNLLKTMEVNFKDIF